MTSSEVKFRSYGPHDKVRLTEIFLSNCPKYFQASDEESFIEFLDLYADHNFLIVENQTGLIGCGGHYVRHDKKMVGIAWVMVQRHALGPRAFRSIADRLFCEIMARIEKEPVQYDIVINTTQVMEKLFQHYGFSATERTPGAYGKGLDHVVMVRPAIQNA